MKIEIFDVEHGQCAMITCPPNGKKLMIDAGHNAGKWWPSIHFYGQEIEKLVVTNYDGDHTSDVVDLRKYCRVKSIAVNPSISSGVLYRMKALTGGMGNGVQHMHDWLAAIEHLPGGGSVSVDLGNVAVQHYWVRYPTLTDVNNLSLVSFVSYDEFKILFPGDLERAGWEQLLKGDDFKRDVQSTTVLVASHHGRENGCCEELYNGANSLMGWKPAATIISDAGMEHATQETVGWYSTRTRGCKTWSGGERKVFTTRTDGKITIDVNPNGEWSIGPDGTSRALPNPWSARSILASGGL